MQQDCTVMHIVFRYRWRYKSDLENLLQKYVTVTQFPERYPRMVGYMQWWSEVVTVWMI